MAGTDMGAHPGGDGVQSVPEAPQEAEAGGHGVRADMDSREQPIERSADGARPAGDAPLQSAGLAPSAPLSPCLNVLVLAEEFGRGDGGVLTFNADLTSALAENGHHVTVLVNRESTEEPRSDRLTVVSEATSAGVRERLRQLLPGVDAIVGHSRFSGPAACQLREEQFPQAALVHFAHIIHAASGRLWGDEAAGLRAEAVERGLIAACDVAVGVGPALTDEVRRLAAETDSAPIIHELIPGVPFTDQVRPPEREGPLNVLLFGRIDTPRKGVGEAAEMIRHLNARGLDVTLTARGAPLETVERTRDMLSTIAGRAVTVLPYTTDPAELRADLRAANVVIMPSRGEHFGLVGTEAMGAGVPVLLPSSSGVGRFAGTPGLLPATITRKMLVPQGFEAKIPIGPWVDHLEAALRDQPGSWERAAVVQKLLHDQNRTWRTAAELFAGILLELKDSR